MTKQKSRDATKKDKNLLWIAAAIGLLGNLAGNFIWETSSPSTKGAMGIFGIVGFAIVVIILSRGHGQIKS